MAKGNDVPTWLGVLVLVVGAITLLGDWGIIGFTVGSLQGTLLTLAGLYYVTCC